MTLPNINAMYREVFKFIDEYQQGRQHSFDEYNHFINQLRNSASIDTFFQLFEADTQFDRDQFKSIVITIEEKVEKLMAARYLNGETHWIESRMAPGYPMVQREINALGLTGDDCLYFIGSGALPFTAMLCHDICGARAVCVDRDEEALTLAKAAVTKRYGVEECNRNFDFILASAESMLVPDRGIRHMILAAHCGMKEGILNGLSRSISHDCRVLVRLPLGVYHYVYDTVNLSLCPAYKKEMSPVRDEHEPFFNGWILTPASPQRLKRV